MPRPEPAAWSAPVRLAEVGRGLDLALEADERTRQRIARNLGLVRLLSFTAEVRLSPWMDGAAVDGRWAATITQLCGVSVEEFDTTLQGAFLVRCVPQGSPLAVTPEQAEIDPEAEDPPDVLDGDVIDVGGYLVEHLSLEIDPFPRKPGVEFEPPPPEETGSPFAALLKLKSGRGPEAKE